MTLEKLSLSFEPALAERARRAAEATGQSLSVFVAGAVEYRLKLEEGRRSWRSGRPSRGPIIDGGAGSVEVEVAGLTLDTGALIGADRSDRAFWAFWKGAAGRGVVLVISAPALAQSWRTSRQLGLHRVVEACWVEPWMRRSPNRPANSADGPRPPTWSDAAVVAGASRRDDVVLTSSRDLRRLAAVAGIVEVIKL